MSESIFFSFDEIFLFRVWIPSFFIVAGLETLILELGQVQFRFGTGRGQIDRKGFGSG